MKLAKENVGIGLLVDAFGDGQFVQPRIAPQNPREFRREVGGTRRKKEAFSQPGPALVPECK